MPEALLRIVPSPVREGTRSPKEGLPGDPGVWMLLTADVSLFGVFFFVFVRDRLADPALYEQSRQHLSAGIGLANTLVLVTSSLFMAFAVAAARAGDREAVTRSLALTLLGGAGFAVLKVVEYGQKIVAGINITTNAFFAYYFAFTAIHFFHLLIGMGVLAVCLAKARRQPIDDRYVVWIESGGCYWHMVDLLWIVLFPMLYLLRAS
jgi:nitric oxide reductase NorE protein